MDQSESSPTAGKTFWSRLTPTISHLFDRNYDKPPFLLELRSSTKFIVTTIGLGIFTDLFLYGLIVPVVPFMLEERIGLPKSEIQGKVSMLLAVYAGASVAIAPVAGVLADRTSSRQTPFLLGLLALLAATFLFAIGQSLFVLVIARILQGISGAVVWTIGLALCLETVGPERLGTVVGTIFSVISVGTQASPTIGGALYERTGYTGVFGIGMLFLVLDFIMRLLVIEKKVAARYRTHENSSRTQTGAEGHERDVRNRTDDEQTPLLGHNHEEEKYCLEPTENRFVKAVPILACLKDPALLASFWLAFVQAFLFGSLDATIPTVARSYYGFDSFKAGLLFLASGVPDLIFGPLGGWWVDKHGTKAPAVFSSAWLVPAHVLLRLVEPGGRHQIIVWAVLLAILGIGLGILGSPTIVEAGAVTNKYYKASPEFFGNNGPFAQLYGLNNMLFCSGLTLGPLIAGALKDSIGYGNMNAILAALSGISVVVSFLFIGGKPKVLRKR